MPPLLPAFDACRYDEEGVSNIKAICVGLPPNDHEVRFQLNGGAMFRILPAGPLGAMGYIPGFADLVEQKQNMWQTKNTINPMGDLKVKPEHMMPSRLCASNTRQGR